MDEKQFWNILEESKRGTNISQDAQMASLRALLDRLDLDEIVAFDRIFDEMRAKSYTHDLWGAAYLINGGCSDDGFEYFRRALIAEGRQKFEAAVRDPETLAEWIEEETEFEEIYYIAREAYRAKAGTEDFPEHDLRFPRAPSGGSWDDGELEARFPLIAEKFGYT
jgi:hypothetical protein